MLLSCCVTFFAETEKVRRVCLCGRHSPGAPHNSPCPSPEVPTPFASRGAALLHHAHRWGSFHIWLLILFHELQTFSSLAAFPFTLLKGSLEEWRSSQLGWGRTPGIFL